MSKPTYEVLWTVYHSLLCLELLVVIILLGVIVYKLS